MADTKYIPSIMLEVNQPDVCGVLMHPDLYDALRDAWPCHHYIFQPPPMQPPRPTFMGKPVMLDGTLTEMGLPTYEVITDTDRWAIECQHHAGQWAPQL